MPAGIATLRQIVSAIATVRSMSEDEHRNLYSRARTMRDRGLICTEFPSGQGREIFYNGADIAAAIVAITLSLNGASQGKIAAINRDLRTFGNNQTLGTPAYEDNLTAILSGVKHIFIRFDVFVRPWESTRARMGLLSELALSDGSSWSNEDVVITETTIIPVSAIVRPVFSALFEG